MKEDTIINALKLISLTYIVIVAIVAVSGCSTQGSQPAKAQTQTFDHCTFTFNNIPCKGDLLTQNQSLESSGQESYAQAPSNPFTVSPQTTATLTRPSVAPDTVSTIASGINSIIKSSKTSKGASASTQCADGNCATGECSDCSECNDCTP